MTIEQTDKIDFIGTLPNDLGVELTISDHLEWDGENKKLVLIQNKLNAYLEFIESGQIYIEYPDAKGKDLFISLVSKHSSNQEGKNFLSQVAKVTSEYGVVFKYRDTNEN